MPSARVLVVVTRSQRRGAEIEGTELAHQLRTCGHAVETVALAPGDVTDGPDVLGRRPMDLATIRRLRRRARGAQLVIAYGSRTLPACAFALVGARVPFVYRSIGSAGRIVNAQRRWRSNVTPNARPRSCLDRCQPRKQVAHAVRAMAYLPHVDLVVAGDGPERAEVEALADAAEHRNVHMVGHVVDPRSVLDAADVVLLTSRTEGMPGVIIEAGLCGVPAVAPAVGAIDAMIVDGVTGYITAGDEPAVVADKVDQSIAKRAQLGDAARTRMLECHSWDAVLPQWLALLADFGVTPAAQPAA